MAPEQLRNQPASPESDLWALGVLLYEMLAGQPPFQGSSFPLTAHQVIMGTPPPVPGVSRAVQSVVDRALEKDPAKRYRQAREMVEDLRRAVGGHVVGGFSVPPLSLVRPAGQTFTTHPVALKKYALAGAIAVGLAATLLLGVHLLPSLGGEPSPVAAESQPAIKAASLSPAARQQPVFTGSPQPSKPPLVSPLKKRPSTLKGRSFLAANAGSTRKRPNQRLPLSAVFRFSLSVAVLSLLPCKNHAKLERVVENHSLGKASFGRKKEKTAFSSTRRVPLLARGFQPLVFTSNRLPAVTGQRMRLLPGPPNHGESQGHCRAGRTRHQRAASRPARHPGQTRSG